MKRLLPVLIASLFLFGCGSSSSSNNTPQPISVALSPSTQTTADQGQTVSFTATVAHDSADKGVTWTMAGSNDCTGAACGTFTSSTTTGAVYNAPATVTASFNVTVTATSASDTTKTASSEVVVNPGPAVSTSSLASGTVGTAYSATLAATGGSGTLTWSLASGTLPAGLTLAASTGVISGTPTATGTSNITVKVTDSASTPASATAQLSIVINNPVLAIITTTLPNGVVGVAYSRTISSSGGDAPITWSWTGSTPPGLQLQGVGTSGASATVAGQPTTAGSYTFTVTARDSSSPAQTKSQSYTINIAAALGITTTSLPSGSVGTGYNQTIGITGGTAPFSWSYSGTLPAGLSFSDGAITGTPTSTGASGFTAKVTDSSTPAQMASQPLSITVEGAMGGTLSITSTSLPDASVGSMYSGAVIVSGGTPPYTYSITPVSPAALPSWLSFNTATGVISGTPTAQGTVSFTVSVTDSTSPTPQSAGPKSLSITINHETAAACQDSGSESLLTGPYAFTLSGYNSTGYVAMIGSFHADGSGHMTAGVVDGTSAQGPHTDISIDTTHSSYSVGSNHLGCATIVTSIGTFNTRLAVGHIVSNVAAAGQMVEWDAPGLSTYFAATGQFMQQTASAFTGGLSGNFAFTEFGGGRFGAVGAMTLSTSGSITAGEVDVNSSGTAQHATGITGSYTTADSNGRFTNSTATTGDTPTHAACYIVSGSQLVCLPTDSNSPAIVEMKKQSGTFGVGSLNATAVFYTGGLSGGGGGDVVIGTFTGNGNGSATLAGAEYDGGAPATWGSMGTCNYAVSTDGLGRMTLSGTNQNCTNNFAAYLTGPNAGFLLRGQESPLIGNFEPQVAPAGGFSHAFSGAYFWGDGNVVSYDEASNEMLGVSVATFTDGTNGTQISDYTSSSTTEGQVEDSNDTIALTINSDGTFSGPSLGEIMGIIISSTKAVMVDNPTDDYPVLMIIKQQ